MAVNVDTVYQKVLALANKEQRGYITPQDFNLFANQAQLEVFEQYFYDLGKARKVQGNDVYAADVDDIIEHKLNVFEVTADPATVAAYPTFGKGKVLPSDVYRVLYVALGKGTLGKECEILNARDYINNKLSPLTRPSVSFPIANIQKNVVKVNNGGTSDLAPNSITYIKNPEKVNWTYVVVNKKAMYNATTTTGHFELHQSEEIQLVNKILRLAGLAAQQPDIMRAGGAMESMTKQEQQKI